MFRRERPLFPFPYRGEAAIHCFTESLRVKAVLGAIRPSTAKLFFDGHGEPSRVEDCNSKTEADLRAKEESIALNCGTYGPERVCSGKYTFTPLTGRGKIAFSLPTILRIARKIAP